MSDEHLIGGREYRPIVIEEYDGRWAERYEEERRRLLDGVGKSLRRLEHIGSTAVPGLAAKPIVDILVSVDDIDDIDDEDSYVPPTLGAGYVLRVREHGHRMFRTPDLAVHVHAWQEGDVEIRRHLLFRDWLRASDDDRDHYAAVKRRLAAVDWEDMNAYAAAKEDVIAEIGRHADAWAAESGWSV